MKSKQLRDRAPKTEQANTDQFAHESEQGEVRAWEQVESGRFMPRRIKGSCKGRELG
jgi:hypothetical protein